MTQEDLQHDAERLAAALERSDHPAAPRARSIVDRLDDVLPDDDEVVVSRRALSILKGQANERESDRSDEHVVEAIQTANEALNHYGTVIRVGDKTGTPL